jgi:putative spermidine/putrescine transport system ATP-binding protein
VVLRDGMVRQIGTPEQLYARPAHADVAEFMGYRNIIRSQAAAEDGGRVSVSVSNALLPATPVERIAPGPVTVAIRPEDLTPAADAPIAAAVESAEYRGRDFYGLARTLDGAELFFRSEARVSPGEAIRLGAPADRVLVYANGAEP